MFGVPLAFSRALAGAAGALAVAAIAGCSSPSARFQDAPTLTQNTAKPRYSAPLSSPSPSYGRPYGVGGASQPVAPTPQGEYQWNGSPNRIAAGGTAKLGVASEPLPPVGGAAATAAPRAVPYSAPYAAAVAPQDVAAGLPVAPRGSITVQPGDTLYALSRQHNVSISALMEVNQLKSLTLQPGQILKLPSTARRSN